MKRHPVRNLGDRDCAPAPAEVLPRTPAPWSPEKAVNTASRVVIARSPRYRAVSSRSCLVSPPAGRAGGSFLRVAAPVQAPQRLGEKGLPMSFVASIASVSTEIKCVAADATCSWLRLFWLGRVGNGMEHRSESSTGDAGCCRPDPVTGYTAAGGVTVN